MSAESRGGRESTALEEAQDEEAFGLCRQRLEQAIDGSCGPDRDWPLRVAAAIHAVMGFADLDPVAVRVLTTHAAVRRFDHPPDFDEMIDHLASLLSHDAPECPRRKPGDSRNIVMRIARQIGQRIECEVGGTMADTAADMIVFALTPYIGFAEAKRWSEWAPHSSAGT